MILAQLCVVLQLFLGVSLSPSRGAADPPAAANLPSDLQSVVEEIAARTFKTAPPIHFASVDELAKAFEADQLALMRATGAGEEQLKKAAEGVRQTAALAAQRLLAYYSHSAKVVLVRPQALDVVSDAKALAPADRERVVALMVAHELMHAAQDQEIGIVRVMTADGPDGKPVVIEEGMARRSVLEGQAMLVQELVAARYQSKDPAWGAAASAADKLAPGALPTEGDKDRYREARIYRGGLEFMRAAHKKGGIEATWEAVRNPPRTMAPFERGGDDFDQARSERLASAMQNAGAFDPSWTAKGRATSPTAGLATQLSRLSVEDRARFNAACTAMGAVVVRDPKGNQGAAMVMRARDDARADFVWLQLGPMNEYPLQALGIKDAKHVEVDEAGTRSDAIFVEQTFPDTSTISMSLARVRRGTLIAQISLVNTGSDAAALRTIGMRLLDAVEKADSAAAK